MNIQLYCETCGTEAKRALLDQPGCRGAHETASEPASCPYGHGLMVRRDGMIQENINGMWVVTGKKPTPDGERCLCCNTLITSTTFCFGDD